MKGLNSVNIINFDNTLIHENKLMAKAKNVYDFTNLQGLKLISSLDILQKLSKKLIDTINNINFIGSGDYHHVTYSIISNIPHKFSLIVFDNHCDYNVLPYGTISCGSWIAQASKLPNLDKILVLGVSNINLNLYNSKVYFLEYDENFLKKALSLINTYITSSIYISIDKDVLDPKYAITNWDQGRMKLNELLYILDYIKEKYNIVGIDISGESRPFNPLTLVLPKEIELNQETNLKILYSLIN
ncbi:MAG: arginase family protein [Caloramator sp.]|nr:arginase family protein [Caloramator sp.]